MEVRRKVSEEGRKGSMLIRPHERKTGSRGKKSDLESVAHNDENRASCHHRIVEKEIVRWKYHAHYTSLSQFVRKCQAFPRGTSACLSRVWIPMRLLIAKNIDHVSSVFSRKHKVLRQPPTEEKSILEQ